MCGSISVDTLHQMASASRYHEFDARRRGRREKRAEPNDAREKSKLGPQQREYTIALVLVTSHVL